MSNLTKDNIAQKYNEVVNEIKELENKEYTYETKVCANSSTPYLAGFGHVDEISNKLALAKMLVHVNNVDNASDLQEAAKALDFEIENDSTLLGVSTDLWIADIKTRAKELKDNERLSNLRSAVTLIERNLSSDDVFNIDMSKVSDLL